MKNQLHSSILILVTAAIIMAMAQFRVGAQTETNLAITLQPGFNLISLPLQSSSPSNDINTVLTNALYNGDPIIIPGACAVYTWDAVLSRFDQPMYAGGDGNWYGDNGLDKYRSLVPGRGFFFSTPDSL